MSSMLLSPQGPVLSGVFLVLAYLVGAPPKVNTQQVPAQQVYRHVLPDAEIVMSINPNAFVAQLQHGLGVLAKDPTFQDPIFQPHIKNAQQLYQMGQMLAIQKLGFDPLKAVKAVTISLRIRHRNPEFLVSLVGPFAPKQFNDTVRKFPRISAPQQAQGWTLYYNNRLGKPRARTESIALSPQGHVLIAEYATLQKQIKQNNPITCPGPHLACRAMALHDANQQVSLAITLPKNPKLYQGVPGFMMNFAKRTEGFHISQQSGKLQLTVWARTPRMVKRYKDMLHGFGLLTKAGDQSSRGLFYIIKGALNFKPSELPPQIRPYVKHKDAIFGFLQRQLKTRQLNIMSSEGPGWARLEILGPPTPLMPFFLSAGGGLLSTVLIRRALRKPHTGKVRYAKPVQIQTRPQKKAVRLNGAVPTSKRSVTAPSAPASRPATR